MTWGGDVVGHGRRPGDIAAAPGALERARMLFQAGTS
jgi:hypothetical protein